MPQKLIKQNYADSVVRKLDDLNKCLRLCNKDFILRGVVEFTSPDRSGLRVNFGHNAAIL